MANSASRRSRASKTTKVKESGRGFVQNTQIVVVPPPSYSIMPSTSMVRLYLCGEYIDVPNALVNDENVFRAVLCKSSFTSLSEAAQNYLKRFLPTATKGTHDADELEKVLGCAFSNDTNFSFTNPISNTFQKLKGGYFSGQNVSDEVQLRSYRRVLYDHYVRNYYVKLLKKVLINRQIILENASNMSSQESNILQHRSFNYISKRKIKNAKQLALRASIRARRLIDDCKARSNDASGLSSDEYDEEDLAAIKPTRLAPGAQSTLYSKKFSIHDLDLHQPIGVEGTVELIKEYRHLCEIEPDCPSCEISDICMEKVYDRAGVSFQFERNFAFALFERSNGATHSSTTPRVNGGSFQNWTS